MIENSLLQFWTNDRVAVIGIGFPALRLIKLFGTLGSGNSLNFSDIRGVNDTRIKSRSAFLTKFNLKYENEDMYDMMPTAIPGHSDLE